MILVGLALTFSRSAVLAIPFGLVVMAVAGVRMSPSPRRTSALLALAIVPAVLLSGGIYYARGGADLLSSTIGTITSTPTPQASATPKLTAIAKSTAIPKATPAPVAVRLALTVSNQYKVGEAHSIKVTAVDANGHTAVSYLGTIHFSATDTSKYVSLPEDYTFTASDHGVHVFGVNLHPGLAFVTPGRQTVTVTDLANASITGSGDVLVVDGKASTNDQSTASHFSSLTQGWALVRENPFGTGLGTVGPRPLPGTSTFPKYNIESYYLAMGVSLGWLGFLWAIFLPLAMLMTAVRAIRKGRRLVGLCLLAFSVCVTLISILLPTMMEPQMAMIPWSLCALAVSTTNGESDEFKSPGGSGAGQSEDAGVDQLVAPQG
jgi:hypothetical protein